MWNTGNYSSNSMGPILDDLNLQCYYGHESKVVGEHKLMAYVRVLLHVCVCLWREQMMPQIPELS
jgi:hypothetical protein